MKIIAIATARNEADIIEAFVRHTLAFCDALIVLDHWSTDATPAILQNLKAEGLPLHLLHDAAIGILQAKHMKMMLEKAVDELGADWIICLDSDEFLQGQGLENLRCLAPGNEFLKIPHYSYIAQPSDEPAIANPVERIVHTIERPAQNWWHYKIIVPATLACQPDMVIPKGNHILEIGKIEAPHSILPDAWLNHFSLRSPGQYGSKLASKVLQVSLDRNAHRGHSRYYEAPYQRLLQSYSRFRADFHDTRLSWDIAESVTSPLTLRPTEYRATPLRYSMANDDTDHFITSIMGLTQGILSMVQAPDVAPTEENATEGPLVAISLKAPRPFAEAEQKPPIIERFRQNQHTYSTLSFIFPSEATIKNLHFTCTAAPGTLVIESLCLYSSDGTSEAFNHTDLAPLLECNHKAIYLKEQTFPRIFCSKVPFNIRFTPLFQNQKKRLFTHATLTVRFTDDPRIVFDTLLIPENLKQLTSSASTNDSLPVGAPGAARPPLAPKKLSPVQRLRKLFHL